PAGKSRLGSRCKYGAPAGEDADAGSGRGDLLAGRLERGMRYEATVLDSGGERGSGFGTRQTDRRHEYRAHGVSDCRIGSRDGRRGSTGSGTYDEAIAQRLRIQEL